MNKERPAIEEVLRKTTPTRLQRSGGRVDLKLDVRLPNRRHLIFAGVSEGVGSNSTTHARVGVFVPGKGDDKGTLSDLLTCEALVVVRPPTKKEARRAPFPDKTTMRVVEVLKPTLEGNRVVCERTGVTEAFVVCI